MNGGLIPASEHLQMPTSWVKMEVCSLSANLWGTTVSRSDSSAGYVYSASPALAASVLRLSSLSTALRESLILLPSLPMHFTIIC